MSRRRKSRNMFEKFKSIQSAMMLSFSAIMVIALLIFLIISLTYTRNTVFNNSTDYISQITQQVNYDIDSYIDYMENISSVVANSVDVPRYLFDENQSEEDREEERKRILTEFQTILDSRDDIYNIAAVADSGRSIVNDGKVGLTDWISICDLDWYQAALESPNGIAVSSSHVQNAIPTSYQWVITLSRALFNNQSGEKEGVFFVDLNYSAISDLCNNSKLGKRGYIFIIDEEGNIIYHPQQQLMYGGLKKENISEIMNSKMDSFVIEDGKDSRLYTMSRSEKTGWTVVGTAYSSELLRNNKQTQLLYFVVAALLLISVVIISHLISRGITRPIENLRDSMSMVQEGKFDKANVEVTTDNEIGSLSRSFNVMTEKIHTLMDQNIYEQKQKRKSELKALQAQINPHFLYNTLDSIIWMSEAGRNEEVVVMTSALARLFRQSISNEKEQVPVSQEIEYVRSYLTIQKMRYKDKLDYHIDVEAAIMNVLIIKFALQPIVENAIYHGIKYKDTKGNLWIRGFMKDDKVQIEIEDDGIGMDAEALAHLFDERKTNFKTNGVGVTNVQKRLQLYYGTDYGISYVSQPGVGTTATVKIPLDGGGNEENV